LRCKIALPVSLLKLTIVEPDFRTNGCGVRSVIGMFDLAVTALKEISRIAL
jgi:hypothetical protein